MSICASGRLRDVISAVMVLNGTEVVEVTCTVGWEVLVLCGYWNVWIDKLCYMGSGGIVWLLECVDR